MISVEICWHGRSAHLLGVLRILLMLWLLLVLRLRWWCIPVLRLWWRERRLMLLVLRMLLILMLLRLWLCLLLLVLMLLLLLVLIRVHVPATRVTAGLLRSAILVLVLSFELGFVLARDRSTVTGRHVG
jgi:hypothetical protein